MSFNMKVHECNECQSWSKKSSKRAANKGGLAGYQKGKSSKEKP